MLFVVPTPVGNLEDMTFRSIRVLKEAELILAEDTRTTGFLLKHYGIETPMRSYHMHNEHKIVEGLANELASGRTMALVTDAGTPGISDPGFLLIREAVKQGVEIQCLPGATAFVPALVNSGLPSDRFTFEGFLPPKKGRQTKLLSLVEEKRTMIFYESPHKLVKTLGDFAEHYGADRPCSVSREISKKFEETIRGSVGEVLEHFQNTAPKGEFVLILGGA
ncbi:16S rRNA (cytidine(1402)-2'-O)-methyltransferase [Phaeocystidibacter marisrubri]|uniref:Ribosomal RNA small subunit methyltransferase I n=1 Tax=Phaeocystidibacter marisrubri TaxID=1577780 RepID=A0A6L3ZFB5_9FLAO|nr:16S rRNA (cytidine(1402)-2'-O)-methyltransferase [Phaeocystidibacter marisrubri]KAB2816134.1 16S rRNA (cytidine(1402)-2'-O)-methyltransferase [Phaeocystidibacter marisrubri]GGH67498.1 ribosomal RNA small subunit methyltransferase I [Phaeocystidibacter marisrubri]